ncbi:MAG: SCO family protein [Candidatus Puniceispirillales bacterium]
MSFINKKSILLVTIIVSFVIILIATFMFAEHLSRQNTPKKISDVLKNINLIDHNGIEFNKASLNEKPSLLFFGFTHCPEICPTTLSQLSEITENLQNPIDLTNIVFITLDPKRDTQDHLKEYIQYFNKNVIAITGQINEIKKLADNWNVFFETIGSSKENYNINHTATVFMLDRTGVFRGTIAWGENEESVIKKIINLNKY